VALNTIFQIFFRRLKKTRNACSLIPNVLHLISGSAFKKPQRSNKGFATVYGEKKETTDSKIVVLDSRPLAAKELLNYLQKRCIPLEIADRFCKEPDFLLYGKKHAVIGFQNEAGGYGLRSENFKGSSSPKDITFIDNRTGDVAVFEGLFSFLSFCTVNKNLTAPQ
jgi:hypothetical protein